MAHPSFSTYFISIRWWNEGKKHLRRNCLELIQSLRMRAIGSLDSAQACLNQDGIFKKCWLCTHVLLLLFLRTKLNSEEFSGHRLTTYTFIGMRFRQHPKTERININAVLGRVSSKNGTWVELGIFSASFNDTNDTSKWKKYDLITSDTRQTDVKQTNVLPKAMLVSALAAPSEKQYFCELRIRSMFQAIKFNFSKKFFWIRIFNRLFVATSFIFQSVVMEMALGLQHIINTWDFWRCA